MQFDYLDKNREGDHICYISDISKMRRHYPGGMPPRPLMICLRLFTGVGATSAFRFSSFDREILEVFTIMHAFEQRLFREILSSLNNQFFDNHDPYRFGKASISVTGRVKRNILSFLHRNRIGLWRHATATQWDAIFLEMNEHLEGISHLYDLLADNYSREQLLKVVAYRALGPTKVKLPLNTPEYWMNIRKIEAGIDTTQPAISAGFSNWELSCVDFNFNATPMRLYLTPSLLYTTYFREQYAYRQSTIIQVAPGDVVIDGGGCYGDTALYFAQLAGPRGRVFSFEPLNENLSVFTRNLRLNSALADRVTVVQRALWNCSDESLKLCVNGPATFMSKEGDSGDSVSAQSITIDDLVRRENLNKISFIKMDIEGAEMNALQGAEQTLRRFTPTLAICLYHNLKDFVSIPAYLDNLHAGYKFYFDHHTIHREESVLYAVAERTTIH